MALNVIELDGLTQQWNAYEGEGARTASSNTDSNGAVPECPVGIGPGADEEASEERGVGGRGSEYAV